MSAPSELEHLAEADGAIFIRSATGSWYARDKDGITVVRGALSRAEAARMYCEDRDLVLSSPEAIRAWIDAQWRPYDTLPSYRQGFDAYMNYGARRPDIDDDGVRGQAYDRGGLAAVWYQRALQHLTDHPDEVEKAGPRWLADLIKGGR
jgi:hypothetical protein